MSISRSLPTKFEELPHEPTPTQEKKKMEMEIQQMDMKSGLDKITDQITEEWEQLIVNELPNIKSPTCVSKPKSDQLTFTPTESNNNNNKPLDEKTSRILERLEIPKKLKPKLPSPITTSNSAPIDTCVLTKKPLIPFRPTQTSDTGTISSQPMRPNFQRLKRKLR